MNDRLKFRAWHRKDNCWSDCWCLHCNGHYSDNTVAQDLAGEPHWKDIPEDLVIMQSTGLKDKNGKLIFEGDIIYDGVKLYFEMIWDPEFAKFVLKTNDDVYMFAQMGGHFDVVGNIYENPELLKKS